MEDQTNINKFSVVQVFRRKILDLIIERRRLNTKKMSKFLDSNLEDHVSQVE